MHITRSSIETAAGPAEWFTGAVYIDALGAPTGPSRLNASSVHFTPGARTAWHTHPNGQTIYVTEGVGRCQRRGGPVETILPGDRVKVEMTPYDLKKGRIVYRFSADRPPVGQTTPPAP